MMRGSVLPLVAVLFAAASGGQAQQERGGTADPRLKKVVDVLKSHDAEMEKAAGKTKALEKSVEKIQKQNAHTQTEVKKLVALGGDVVAVKGEVASVQKALAEIRAALPKATDDRAKADEALKQLQKRIAKLEVTEVAKRVEKLQEQTDKFKLNTETRVTYFGPAPGRQPYYEVRVVSVTGKAKATPGAKIDVITELDGIEGKPVPYTADQNGVVRVPRPDVKRIRGLHHIHFNYAGDDVRQASSRKMQIK